MTSLLDYQIIKSLGEGSFAKVKLAIHTTTNQKVAIKIIKNFTSIKKEKLDKVKQEVKILQSFNHPHIIRVYDFIQNNEGMFIVMEYLPGGELYDLLLKKQRFCENDARVYFQQLIYAIKYCHDKLVVHRDIKPENILLDEHNHIKLGDFGLSGYFKDGIFMKTSCGSLNYAAPEILSGQEYCAPLVDVWSAGVVLFLMVSGELPFDNENIAVLTQKIKKSDFSCPNFISDCCRDLIDRMLDPDPVLRITISQVLNHPWFNINLQNHLTYAADLPEIKSETTCLAKFKKTSLLKIDEEVFKFCLASNVTELDFTEEKIRRRVIKEKQDEFLVAYKILHDSKMKKKRSYLNKICLDINPTFDLGTGLFLDRRGSMELRKSNSVLDEIENIGLMFPHNWVFGFRSNSEINRYVYRFLISCRNLDLVRGS